MVRHQAEGVHDQATLSDNPSNALQEIATVGVAQKHRHAGHAPRHHMVDRPRKLNSRRSTHAAILPIPAVTCNRTKY